MGDRHGRDEPVGTAASSAAPVAPADAGGAVPVAVQDAPDEARDDLSAGASS
jgi:hypothetical protein